ncbi:helix-turn-helix domain-containing protein [Endozoicomonas sp. SM1973]|uniref:Helix-turn-helix domain-containing protein n=1 Tax=Spartinivicinus marinus TaxID=2994442 RepID=A0A853HYL0_9GAMM|nr:helix-turn-helix domain-containing protein [Spartinivicinus marinus]MCX4024690.1 helix-turn-helix domain-containing protein [Spartinivicinus marinus]NYZ66283.1 helix-turn-helix domain-containing protein [Spartinivicinus marinus]
MDTRITLIAIEHMLGTSLTLPMEMLNAANATFQAYHKTRQQPLEIIVGSWDGQPVAITGGLSITPHCSLKDIETTDLIIIPGLWRNPHTTIHNHQPLIKWLQQQYQRQATICAAGTGVALIAEASLLDNQPATTHWYYFDTFSRRYPNIELCRHHLITHSERIYCAGSVNSIADLTVHLIGKLLGEKIATRVEQQFSREIRRPYETSFYSFEDTRNHQDEAIIEAQQWISSNHSQSIHWQQLAEQLQMSLRTFNRRFKAATHQTPSSYLQKIRIQAAKELLNHTNLTIAEISDAVGFNDEGYFARTFKKHALASPSDYRHQVRGKLFSLT